ncbi:AAA domain-containing protein, putative AbiEii toxin, Type IV TA system [Nannocystis exedens]|uniref:AAA domain-containing protein, putative AbiEii toxin, Type IV TA system n=1 Tax=Nannocystis exedens TaxID=54 RepID=A0A1I1WI51_9BACT|nr:AAA family ATPase [Nannocystis exedens]PCC67746.1 chromosome segregation protein SMC [Nannocystis exedens]SFD94826.1 AAA domain-containing protein, putative AbiEii toxin, Type IV TA system [Nannocystis exedens]
MLTEFQVKNFKSIRDLRLEPGRVTVLLGDNGSGKSNLLEAVAFAGAALADKLDHEFLASRGIRATEPRFMRSAFAPGDDTRIDFRLAHGQERVGFHVETSPSRRGFWKKVLTERGVRSPKETLLVDSFRAAFKSVIQDDAERISDDELAEFIDGRLAQMFLLDNFDPLKSFLIYAPESRALRSFEQEGQILPLGVRGEGLFALLKALASEEARLAELREQLRLVDWFEDLQIGAELMPYERAVRIRDRHLAAGEGGPPAYFDQRSASDGFLLLLFCFALVISPDTPKLFAIDDIDAALGPKLGAALTRRLVALAARHGKQILLTARDPAILAGLDLHDPDQRLYTVHRDERGHTRAERVTPQPAADERQSELSEVFRRVLLEGPPTSS